MGHGLFVLAAPGRQTRRDPVQRLAQPATLPWPKIAQTPSMKRSPSSVICTDSQRTMACAAVRRIVVIIPLGSLRLVPEGAKPRA
jgi:hypothetical protein